MNDTLRLLLNRRSIRACEARPISDEDRDLILRATLRTDREQDDRFFGSDDALGARNP